MKTSCATRTATSLGGLYEALGHALLFKSQGAKTLKVPISVVGQAVLPWTATSECLDIIKTLARSRRKAKIVSAK